MRLRIWSTILLVCLSVFGCTAAPELRGDSAPHEGVGRAHTLPVQGIDVSRYQGDIDWAKVRDGDIAFAYLKVSEGGDHVDRRFYEYWREAANAGLRRGAYHFMYWCRKAEEQAIWFSLAVPQDATQLPPVLDLEWNPESPTCSKRLPKAEALREIDVMLNAMEAHTGKRPIIYTDINFHRDVLAGQYRSYEFWLRSVAAEPDARYPGRNWTFWQYTSTGRVPGIKGPVDRNAFVGSKRSWDDWLKRRGSE